MTRIVDRPKQADAATREVALLRREGDHNAEFPERLDSSLSSVERKLRLIRDFWEQEFPC
ncbi:MAG: ECF-type sigma factor [Planctomycetaceae bacterium]